MADRDEQFRDRAYDDEVKKVYVEALCEHLSPEEHAVLRSALEANAGGDPQDLEPREGSIPGPARPMAVYWATRKDLAVALRLRDLEEEHGAAPELAGWPMWKVMAKGLAKTAAVDIRAIIHDGTIPSRQRPDVEEAQ